jgi:hypothetical protein
MWIKCRIGIYSKITTRFYWLTLWTNKYPYIAFKNSLSPSQKSQCISNEIKSLYTITENYLYFFRDIYKTHKHNPHTKCTDYNTEMLRQTVTSWCNLTRITRTINITSFSPDILDDHVDDNITCAKIIYHVHGFSAWNGWLSKCKNPAAVCLC